MTIQWNSQTLAAATNMGAQEEYVTDMDGCTSQGYNFNMAIITSVPGS
jgi:hypothetical protein